MSIKEDFKELFTFTQSEKRGIMILIIILFIVIGIYISIPYIYSEKPHDFSGFIAELDSFEAQRVKIGEQSYETRLNQVINKKYDSLQLFNFDPNEMDYDIGLKLGLTKKQIYTIIGHIRRGEVFMEKEDFKNIKGIRQRQYEILEPYIVFNKKQRKSGKRFQKETGKTTETEPEMLFDFDPNTADESELKQLGFSEKQISTITNFRKKGGKFKTPDDLSKIYGINAEQIDELTPYVKIHSKEKTISYSRNMVDINNLDETELSSLGGFWKYNAQKIIKYRNSLGGFYSATQIAESYGVKKDFFEQLKDSVFVDKTKIKQIRINFADTDELSKHPYLSYKEARAIIDFRDKNGPFNDLNILKTKNIIGNETYNKIINYLTVY